MTKNWHKYQTAMVNADQCIDKVHKLAAQKKWNAALMWIDSETMRTAVKSYYGESVLETLKDQVLTAMEETFN